MSISNKDQKILWGRSGNFCAIADCRQELIEDCNGADAEAVIGEMAHIKGENPRSARYDSSMTSSERNCYKNLILLCPNCHETIDKQVQRYTVDFLYEVKTKHESWVRETLGTEMISITFAELEVVTKYLISSSYAQNDEMILITPKEKIKKNEFSSETEKLIKMGMIQSRNVLDYINANADENFGERLKKGFVSEYLALREGKEKLHGDALFEELMKFASRGSIKFSEKAAGLAVLTYFFEACDIFEK